MPNYHEFIPEEKLTPLQVRVNFFKDLLMGLGVILTVGGFVCLPWVFFFRSNRYAPFKLPSALKNSQLINSIPGSFTFNSIALNVAAIGLIIILCSCLVKRKPEKRRSK